MEWDLRFRSNNSQEDSLSALQEWTTLYNSALDASPGLKGRRITQVSQIEDMIRAARFESVQCQVVEVPTCGWNNGEIVT